MYTCVRSTDVDEITGIVNGIKGPSLNVSLAVWWPTDLISQLCLTDTINVDLIYGLDHRWGSILTNYGQKYEDDGKPIGKKEKKPLVRVLGICLYWRCEMVVDTLDQNNFFISSAPLLLSLFFLDLLSFHPPTHLQSVVTQWIDGLTCSHFLGSPSLSNQKSKQLHLLLGYRYCDYYLNVSKVVIVGFCWI